jgi:hypothetical protein
MTLDLDAIEARAAKYHVRSKLPQVEDLQDDRDALLAMVREQAAQLEAVRALAEGAARFTVFGGGSAPGIVMTDRILAALEPTL